MVLGKMKEEMNGTPISELDAFHPDGGGKHQNVERHKKIWGKKGDNA